MHSDWRTLTKALRELHRALVERARTDHLRENLIGGDIGPSDLLRLLTTDVKRALAAWPAARAVGREALLQERKALGVRPREEQ